MRYEYVVEALRAEIARLLPVYEASKAMRAGHEGCVTEPPCGKCSRCDFDLAVDNAVAAEIAAEVK